MPKRSSPIAATSPKVDAPTLRSTAAGSERFQERFHERFTGDYFRAATNGLVLSSIGIGTYLGDSTDEIDTAYEAAIRHAIGSGVNVIDTAINYRCQRSERATGAAIQRALADGAANRDELVVCSKGGYIPLDKTPPATREEYQQYVRREFIDQEILRPDEIASGGHSFAPRFLRYCLAKSRQNLGLRTIDIYYLHNPGHLLSTFTADEAKARIRAAMMVLEEAAGRGEIGVYGCATWDELRVQPDARGHLALETVVEIAKEIAGDGHHFRAVQLPVNLAMAEAVRLPTQPLAGTLVTVVEAAAALGLTVVGSASLMQGQLAEGLPAALHDHYPGLETDAQRAIAFARAIPGQTTALVGMKQVQHVDEILAAAR
jgi:aryl-alcohol dehydrogenase-like predicted oxidoreductase